MIFNAMKPSMKAPLRLALGFIDYWNDLEGCGSIMVESVLISQLALWIYFINSYSRASIYLLFALTLCMCNCVLINLKMNKTKWYSFVFVISGALCDHNFVIIITCWISFTYWNMHRCVLLAFSIHMVLVCALMMAVWSAILLHRSVCHILWVLFSIAMGYCAFKHHSGSTCRRYVDNQWQFMVMENKLEVSNMFLIW